MKWLGDLAKSGILFQGILVVLVAASVCGLAVAGRQVPEVLTAGFGMIIGYFFANSGRVNTINGVEKVIRSLREEGQTKDPE